MEFRETGTSVNETVTDTPPAAKAAAKPRKPAKEGDSPPESHYIDPHPYPVEVDHSRDALLTDFGKDTLNDRYLLPGETYQDLFVRVASAYADDAAHAQRLYDYISQAVVHAGDARCCRTAAPAAACRSRCYLNTVPDSLEGIVGTWNENVWLASRGGGIGTYWGNVRGIGEPVGLNGKTSGIIPFVRVMDSADAGDQPGLAAPRLGRLLSRHLASRDRGVPRDPQALGRLQPQGAQPPPRRARHRRVHGSGARRRRIRRCAAPKDGSRSAARSTPARCSRSWSRPASRPASPTSSSSTR